VSEIFAPYTITTNINLTKEINNTCIAHKDNHKLTKTFDSSEAIPWRTLSNTSNLVVALPSPTTISNLNLRHYVPNCQYNNQHNDNQIPE
jgi:hypothetical protein